MRIAATQIQNLYRSKDPEHRMPNNQYLPQYVNPQHTDTLFNDSQLGQCFSTPRTPNALTSPFLPSPTSISPATPGQISESSQSGISNPSTASTATNSPGYLTPPSSTSSRRHSMESPDHHQSFLSASQPSPTPGARRLRFGQQVDPNFVNKPFKTYQEPLGVALGAFSHDASHAAGPEPELFNSVDAFNGKHNLDWQYAQVSIPTDDAGISIDIHGCLGMDLAAGFDASMSEHLPELPRDTTDCSSISALTTVSGRIRSSAQSHATSLHNIVPFMLENHFEPLAQGTDDDIEMSTCPKYSSNPVKRQRKSVPSRRRKGPKITLPKWEETLVVERQKDNGHPCPKCENSFKRPEHLKRHIRKHLPEQETNMLPCSFAPECSRKIKDRKDNLRAHLQATHFKYGKTEKGGKNKRFSMKDSMHRGLRSEDPRWTLLLENKLEVGDNETGYWKMLGYSIKETQEMRVKDLIPEWDGSEDVLLKEFDPRWKKLLEGTMTFEQTMQKGVWMPGDEREGVLGINMKTSEAMGLKQFDPRWRKLLEGDMSCELAEKLEVMHLHPTWTGRHSQ